MKIARNTQRARLISPAGRLIIFNPDSEVRRTAPQSNHARFASRYMDEADCGSPFPPSNHARPASQYSNETACKRLQRRERGGPQSAAEKTVLLSRRRDTPRFCGEDAKFLRRRGATERFHREEGPRSRRRQYFTTFRPNCCATSESGFKGASVTCPEPDWTATRLTMALRNLGGRAATSR